jgi:hypothetical protein
MLASACCSSDTSATWLLIRSASSRYDTRAWLSRLITCAPLTPVAPARARAVRTVPAWMAERAEPAASRALGLFQLQLAADPFIADTQRRRTEHTK